MCIFAADSILVNTTSFPSMQPKQFRIISEQQHAGKCSPHPSIPFPLSPTRKMPAVHHKLLLEEALQDSPQVKNPFTGPLFNALVLITVWFCAFSVTNQMKCGCRDARTSLVAAFMCQLIKTKHSFRLNLSALFGGESPQLV